MAHGMRSSWNRTNEPQHYSHISINPKGCVYVIEVRFQINGWTVFLPLWRFMAWFPKLRWLGKVLRHQLRGHPQS
eukprot:2616347-Amphidinium_carterae.1